MKHTEDELKEISEPIDMSKNSLSGWTEIILGSDKSKLDGYDLGILIRVHRHNLVFRHRDDYFGITMDMVMSELISEAGWLKGGYCELNERLKKLEKIGYLFSFNIPSYKNKHCCIRYWKITQKALDEFEGLR